MATQQLATIQNVDIRQAWPDEARNFTPWLAENISLLGDALGLNLEATSTEAAVGGYRLDILGRDAGRDVLVAIENQLGQTDHNHLGQLLTYTAGHDAKVAIWIAGEFRDEHREALDMLNHRTDEDSEFYGVVVELWTIGDSPPAPHFRVVSAPNHWGKQQRRGKSEGESELSQRYYDFFKGLVDELGDGPDAPTPRSVSGRSALVFRTDYRGLHYGLVLASSGGGQAKVELYIDCGDREANKERFDFLAESKDEIELVVGESLNWERLDHRRACRISASRAGSIRDDEKKLGEIRSWMIDTLPKIKTAFAPKLAEMVSDLIGSAPSELID